MMAAPGVSLTLTNDLRELPRVTQALEAFCARHGVSPATLMALNLAIEEVFTNVVSYGFDGASTHRIGLEITLEENGTIEATVVDDGRPYDPLQREDPDVEKPLDERTIGGLGVMLVKRLMDEVTYARRDGRNVLTLRKRAAAGG